MLNNYTIVLNLQHDLSPARFPFYTFSFPDYFLPYSTNSQLSTFSSYLPQLFHSLLSTEDIASYFPEEIKATRSCSFCRGHRPLQPCGP